MPRLFLALLLSAGVAFGYGTAALSVAHHAGDGWTCPKGAWGHHDRSNATTPAEQPDPER